MISTLRLKIFKWTEDQALDFYQLTQDDGFNLFPITIYRQANVESARLWIQQNTAKMAVIEKQSGAVIGMGGLTPWKFGEENLIDITYRIRASAWRQGFGLEL